MTTTVIIDAIVVVVLMAFAIYGAKRGLLRTLAGLVIVVVALVGAGMIAATFSTPVTKLVAPVLQEHIAAQVEEAMTDQADEAADDASLIEELLVRLGLDADVRESMTEKAQERIQNTGATIAAAVVESMVYSFVHGLLFVLAFLALLLLLKVLVGAMDIVMKLPVLHGLNALGGGLLGLIEGALLLFLAVWAARRLGVSFETEALADAHILRIFTTNTPLGLLSFLQ